MGTFARVCSAMQSKQELRQQCRAQLCARPEASAAICQRLLALPAYRAAEALMAYYPLFGEPDITPVLRDALRAGKRLYLPQTDAQRQIHPRQVTSLCQLQPGRYGVMEPPETLPESRDFSLILMPAVAYDRRCRRLGHGAGCYDRFLADYAGVTVGVCFSAFLLETVPIDSHDRAADLVCTEQEILYSMDR